MSSSLPDEIDVEESPRAYAPEAGKEAFASFLGSYGDILSSIGLAPKQNLTPGQEALYKAEYQAPESALSYLQDEDILPRYTRLPKSEEIRGLLQTKEPETKTERYLQRASKYLGGGLAFGATPAQLGSLAATSVIGQTAEEAGAPPGAQLVLELLATHGPSGFKKGIVPSKDQKEFVNYAQKLGLKDSEISALIKGEATKATLAKLAQPGPKLKKFVSSIGEKLGEGYEELKEQGRNLGRLTGEEAENFSDKIGNIIEKLSRTVKPSSDKQSAIKYLQESAENIRNKGLTYEDLINWYQDVNHEVNWNAIKGKKQIAAIKKDIVDTIRTKDKTLANDFENLNKGYSEFIDLAKDLSPSIVTELLHEGPKGAIVIGAATGNKSLLTSGLKSLGMGYAAREMLMSSRFQGIGKKLTEAMKNGNAKTINILYNQIKKEAEKNMPDEIDIE